MNSTQGRSDRFFSLMETKQYWSSYETDFLQKKKKVSISSYAVFRDKYQKA